VEGSLIRQFLFPRITASFVLRALAVAVGAYLCFSYVCIPFRVDGRSMEPTYHDGSFNFCWTLGYAFSEPRHHDVVTVRFAGRKIMLLKRIVAVGGDSVEFRNGALLVNGEETREPYVRYPCDWNLSRRDVAPGHVYVVGDNRSGPIVQHYFGQTPVGRIVGTPLW